jgi:hypothetical protein
MVNGSGQFGAKLMALVFRAVHYSVVTPLGHVIGIGAVVVFSAWR